MLSLRWLLFAAVAAASAAADPVAISLAGDASADYVAVAVFGNATAGVAVAGFGNATTCGSPAQCAAAVTLSGAADCNRGLSCTSVSLLGPAFAEARCIGSFIQVCGVATAVSGAGNAEGGMAVAAMGDSTGVLSASVAGNARGGDLALSTLGHAECLIDLCLSVGGAGSDACDGARGRVAPFNCVSIAALGDAEACNGADRAWECTAISGTGDSESCSTQNGSYQCVAASGTGSASSDYAIAGVGNATARENRISGTQVFLGGAAVSAAGNATSCSTRESCVAVSGTGEATGTTSVSGCETLAGLGRSEACV